MVDFASVENDLKGFVQGDIEIAGKRIPKVAVAGVAVGGIALFVFVSKRGQNQSANGTSIPQGIGNANPSVSSQGTADNTALGQSAIDQLGTQLSGIPSANKNPNLPGGLDFGMGNNPNTEVGYSSGNLSDFLSQLPSLDSFQSPAFQYLPDLSGYNIAQPLQDYSQQLGVSVPPYSNPSVTTKPVVQANTPVVQKITTPLSQLAKNVLNGVGSTLPLPKVTNNTSGNAIVKLPSPSVPVKPVNTGNAVVSNPINLIKNLFGNSGSGVTVISTNPTYGSIGYNWAKSNPIPLPIEPKPIPIPAPLPVINYASPGYNWSSPPKQPVKSGNAIVQNGLNRLWG